MDERVNKPEFPLLNSQAKAVADELSLIFTGGSSGEGLHISQTAITDVEPFVAAYRVLDALGRRDLLFPREQDQDIQDTKVDKLISDVGIEILRGTEREVKLGSLVVGKKLKGCVVRVPLLDRDPNEQSWILDIICERKKKRWRTSFSLYPAAEPELLNGEGN